MVISVSIFFVYLVGINNSMKSSNSQIGKKILLMLNCLILFVAGSAYLNGIILKSPIALEGASTLSFLFIAPTQFILTLLIAPAKEGEFILLTMFFTLFSCFVSFCYLPWSTILVAIIFLIFAGYCVFLAFK